MAFFSTFLAACDPIIGCISPPPGMPDAIGPGGELTGVTAFLNVILRIIFIAAGLWAFFNLIRAGFSFMNAGGDPKAVAAAWEMIWKSGVGLIIIVTSFLVAAVVGMLLFGSPSAILVPTLGTPPP